MKIDAVFEGGGVKGVAFTGAITYLEEQGYEFNRVAGTSAGSIIASLLAVGYTGAELKDIIMSLDYSKMLDKDSLQSIPLIGKYIALFREKGMYKGDYIENWINELLKAKNKTTFKDVYVEGDFRLKIVTTDINNQDLIVLPNALVDYGIDPMNFSIARAVRMSISIPFFFKPITLDYTDISDKTNKTGYFVDGGVLSNFPVWLFDVEGVPNCPTFGFKLGSSKTYNEITSKTNIKNYLSCLVETIIDKNEEVFLRKKDNVRTMDIPTLGVGTTDFNITKETSLKLFQSGYDTAKSFLNNWDFEQYIKKYRKGEKDEQIVGRDIRTN